MKRSLWLITVLAGALGCGSSDDGVTDDKDPSSTGGTSGKGGVMKADGGVHKPVGPSQPSDHRNPNVDQYGNPIGDAGYDSADDTCEKLQLPANPNSPDILIVLDRSGSMVGLGGGPNRWMPSVAAIKQLTSSLTETVAFGLLTFPAPAAPGMMGGGGITIPGIGTFPAGGGGGASSCLPGKLEVPVDVNNADQIASVLDMSTPDFGATPTADSLAIAKDALDTGTCGDCPEKPKYVLLVTDGQPNCGENGTMTTQADVDAVNTVIDELSAAKIKTYVIGYDTTDMASAAIMDSFAMHGGTEHQYPVENQQTLVDELTRIAGSLIPCSFDLTGTVDDPALLRVEIDGKTYIYGTDWTLEGQKVVLDPMGGACPKLRDAKVHDLRITRECTPVQAL